MGTQPRIALRGSRAAGWMGIVFLVLSAFSAPIAAAEIILENATMDYYVSDYGWSDTWLVPPQLANNAQYDLLSGDDAGNLHYKVDGVDLSGNGWLTPTLDAGTLAPTFATGSPWIITTPNHFLVPNVSAESVITQPVHHLQVTIDTSIAGGVVHQTYTVLNTGNHVISDLHFADYFNPHPDSSTAPGYLLGSMQFINGSLYAYDTMNWPLFISNVYMHGDRFPNAWDMNATPPPTIADVAAQTYNMVPGPLLTNDIAGALAFYDPNPLMPGDQYVFRIEKGLGQPTPIPEPTSFVLAALGLIGPAALAARKARRGRTSVG